MRPTPVRTYPLGSIVFLRVDPGQKGMVTGHLERPGGALIYLVTWGGPIEEREHYVCELTDEVDYAPGTAEEGT